MPAMHNKFPEISGNFPQIINFRKMYKPIHDRAYKLQGLVKTTTNLECAQCQGNLKQEERHS